jgi:hypothetical protein
MGRHESDSCVRRPHRANPGNVSAFHYEEKETIRRSAIKRRATKSLLVRRTLLDTEIIVELERDGHDSKEAKKLFAQFLIMQACTLSIAVNWNES